MVTGGRVSAHFYRLVAEDYGNNIKMPFFVYRMPTKMWADTWKARDGSVWWTNCMDRSKYYERGQIGMN
jgi:hypothetical protein